MSGTQKVVIDAEQLESLRELNEPGGQDIVTELIDIFLDQNPITLQDLKEQVAQKNAPFVERLAHKLKGSCANLGAEYMRSLCQLMEDKARHRAFDEFAPLMQEIDLAFSEVCETLKRDWRRPAA